MAAPTEVYVDEVDGPSGLGDGTTFANAYGDLQTALDGETAGGSGHRFNVYATGTTQTAAYNFTTYGASTVSAPVIIQGMSSAGVAGDGGIAVFDGNATYSFINSITQNYVFLADLDLKNSGSADILTLNNNCGVVNCEFSNSSGRGIDTDFQFYAINCYFHDIGLECIFGAQMYIAGCRFEDGTKKMRRAIQETSSDGGCFYNTIWLNDTAGIGIETAKNCRISHNSIYNNTAGTASGIVVVTANDVANISNNLIEGFNGTGGEGIKLVTNGNVGYCDGNAFYACTANIENSGQILYGDTNNEALGASPFTDAANKDFRPVDTGSVKEGALPGGVGLY